MNVSTVILVAFVTAALTSTGTVFVLQRAGMLAPNAGASTEEQVVPDFSGLSEADARANAAVAHVALLVAGREQAAGKKPGTVIRQSAPAGQRVPREHPVSVVLADELPRVPKVVGLAAAEASARLEQAGYKVAVGAKIPDASVPDGNVLSQVPAADETLDKGATVTLRVSSGPLNVEVPRLVGTGVPTARAMLEKLGLKPVVQWVSVAETQGLIVLRQTPGAGEKAKPGTEVQIVANQ